MMRNGIRRRGVLAGSALILCLLTGCKGKEPALSPPDAYVLGEDSAPALDKVMEDEEGTLVSVEEPSQENGQRYIYHYEELSQPAALVSLYVERMMEEEEGFVLADEEHRALSAQPELTGDTGSVILIRPSTSEGKIFQITVRWDGDTGTVEVTEQAGEIISSDEGDSTFLLVDQLDYLYSLPPARLGLEGSSMKSYRIYPTEGVVMVDGKLCRQFNVYRVKAPEQTNSIEGTYFLSTDRLYIYQLDGSTGATINLT